MVSVVSEVRGFCGCVFLLESRLIKVIKFWVNLIVICLFMEFDGIILCIKLVMVEFLCILLILVIEVIKFGCIDVI